MLNYRQIKELWGQFIHPTPWKIEDTWIEIKQNNMTSIYPTGAKEAQQRERRFEQSERFKLEPLNLKAGPATVTYYAAGVSTPPVETVLMEGSTLVTSLPFDRFPYGLFLLIPGILILGLRAGLEWWWRQSKRDFRNLGLLLIIISLGLWGVTFFVLYLRLRYTNSFALHIFHPALSFSLAIPVFGFLGSLLFVIDVFQSRMPAALSSDQGDYLTINTSMEFVLRLVLGPYVAIVMVLLFRDTFTFVQVSDQLGAQATVAFFSGFLVVLFLQSLSEKGNEVLGNWRSSSRYESSEIARELNLAPEEDLKLRRVNLKYLSHLQRLSDEDVVQMAKQSELNEGFLFSLRDEARARRIHDVPLLAQHLQEQIGTAVWAKLQQEGIKSVWDLAVRTPDEINKIAKTHNIDPGILTKYSDAAKALALAQHLQGRIGTELWAKLHKEGIKSVWDLAARTPDEINKIAKTHNIDPGILTKYSDDAKALAKTPLF